METVETLTQEIIDKLYELKIMTDKIASLSPVTYKSQSKIQWAGGIMGAIQESKENKRLVELINSPLMDDQSFIDIAESVIPQATNYLVERQSQIQQLVDKDDKRYYGFVVDIFNSIEKLTYAWYKYSPDMANTTFNDLKNGTLFATVNQSTEELIKKLNLPQDIIDHYAKNDKQHIESSGCLGLFVMIIVTTMAVLGGVAYGLYKFI